MRESRVDFRPRHRTFSQERTVRSWSYPMVVAIAAATLLPGACSEQHAAAPTEAAEEVGEAQDALSSAGMERIIPIRFSVLSWCSPGVAGCTWLVDYEDIQRNVRVANEVFRAAGVQFYVESVQQHAVPDLFLHMNNRDANGILVEVPFTTVKDDLKTLFPDMHDDAWEDAQLKNARHWVHAANAVYEDVRHVHVWITGNPTTDAKSSASMPESGRGIRMLQQHVAGTGEVFAHEMGHFLGLRHTNAADTHARAPSTLTQWKMSDRWDLVYVPGTSPTNPDRFFSSKADAALFESSLRLIDNDATCSVGPDDFMLCSFPSYPSSPIHLTGSDALKGLSFTFPSDNHGSNIMRTGGRPRPGPWTISDSQAAQIRQYLRWDVPFDFEPEDEDDPSTDYITPGYRYPLPALGGRRPRLGHARAAEPAPQLDFDADGIRDIAVYYSPSSFASLGKFYVYLSSEGFSSAPGDYIYVQLGHVGDTPVPADYNGDGRTDVAVYSHGGGVSGDDPSSTTSRWRWCPTGSIPTNTPTSCTPTAISYGSRGDVPQYGLELDGQPGADLSVFRPSTGTWYYRNVPGTVSGSKVIGHVRGGVVPMPGLYDCDELSDLAVYEPTTAKFKLMLSGNGYSTTTTHQFDTAFIPLPAGVGEERAAPLAMAGMVSRRACSNGSTLVFKPRRAAALFYPEDVTWNILWNPTSTTTTIDSCAYGNGERDQPIAGLDANDDGRSDMAAFRTADASNADGAIRTKVATAGACSGATASTACVGCGRPRDRAWAVADTTGDDEPDLMVLDPVTSELRVYSSESGFSAYPISMTLVSAFADVL